MPPRKKTAPAPAGLREAVAAEIAALRRPGVPAGFESDAALAVELAGQVVSVDAPAAAKASCARALVDVLDRLRAAAPKQDERPNPVDEIAVRRQRRRGVGS